MNTVHPFPTLHGQVGVRVQRAVIDGRVLPLSSISQQEQVLSFHQFDGDDWSEGFVELEVTLPQDELVDGPWASVVCVAVLTEGATNARVVSRLERGRDDQHWRGEVRMLRSMHLARATLDVSVVGSYGGVDGRIIGRSVRPWFIDILTRTPTREREIEIVEADFREGDQEWLRPFRDAPWLVDTAGDMPRVLLNTSVEGVAGLLRAPRGGLEKAIAGVVAAQIAGEVWTAMFYSALEELEFDEDGAPRLPGGWKEPVLRAMLPDVFPGRPLADALLEVHYRMREARGRAELQPRIQFAASRRAGTLRSLSTAIRAVSRAQEGTNR